jgi:hypothetical protein
VSANPENACAPPPVPVDFKGEGKKILNYPISIDWTQIFKHYCSKFWFIEAFASWKYKSHWLEHLLFPHGKRLSSQ